MQLLKSFVVVALAVCGLAAAQADPKHPGGCPNVDTCAGRCKIFGSTGGTCGGEGNTVCTCN